MKNQALRFTIDHMTPESKPTVKDHFFRFLMTCLVAGAVLTVLAPYGTQSLGLLGRAVFWVSLCFAGGLGAASVAYVCHIRSITLSPVSMTLWQSLGATVLVSLFVIGLNHSRFGTTSLLGVIIVVFYVWVIAVTLSAIGNLIGHRRAGPSPSQSVSRPAIYERIKPNLRSADIYAISAEDHYVRVHTSKGEDLILMRLSDAVNEMAPLSGLSPHRSWWVAEAGVKSIVKKDGKTIVALHSDVQVPVSRGRVKDLKDAGWT